MIKSKFINDLLELLFESNEEGDIAKLQLDFLKESDYQYAGTGVFIGFEFKTGIEKYKTEKHNLIMDGVIIKSPDIEGQAECRLFFKYGLFDYLEIWLKSGEFPLKELSDYELTLKV